MSEKLLHIDVETTGLDERIAEPHQIAIIIEIDKEIRHKEVFYSQPINWDTINPEALSKSRVSIDTLRTYPLPMVTYAKVNHLLCQFVNKYDKEDKFIAVGYNVRFDMRMMDAWYRKLHNDYFYSLVNSKTVYDVMEYISLFIKLGILEPLGNIKLTTVCEYLGIDMIEAHQAMFDIQATRKLYWRCMRVFDKLKYYINREKIIMERGDVDDDNSD